MLYDERMLIREKGDIDLWITRHALKWWGRSLTLDAIVSAVSEWTPIIMVGLIAVEAFGVGLPASPKPFGRPGMMAVMAVVTAVLARIMNEPMSVMLHRPRPFESVGFIPLVGHDAGDSFPSNHATGAFALAIAMTGVPGYGHLLLVLGTMLALSRVYVGLHYLTDVVAGAIHGTVVAWIVRLLFQSLHILSHSGAW